MKTVFVKSGLKTLAACLANCGYRDFEGIIDSLCTNIESMVDNGDVVHDEIVVQTYAAYCLLNSNVFDAYSAPDADDGIIRFLLTYLDNLESAVSVVIENYYHKDLRENFFRTFNESAKEMLELRAGTLFNYGC